MDRQAALQALGLNTDASQQDIATALAAKRQDLVDKKTSAPTEALKAKFVTLENKLADIEQALAQAAPHSSAEQPSATTSRPASLSQTKMADLPQSQQSHTGFDGGQAGVQIHLQPGQLLANRYEIKEHIAAGGMGAVYRVFDRNRAQDIAIKVMLPALMQNERARERFLAEARLSSQLSHPGIVNVYDVQNDGDLYFLTMELLEGQDLRQLMENRKLAHQPFTVQDVAEILAPLCSALDHAHEITVHRDIKPENVYLTHDSRYKLMDFGIAQLMSTSQRTKTGAAMGTAYYMAPEQLKGQSDIDARADQYALAVMAYELLSGEVPAGAIQPLHGQIKGISRKTSDAIQKALSPKRENRFASLAEFLAAFSGKASSGLSLPELPWKGIGMAAALLLAVIGVGAVVSGGGINLGGLLPMSAEQKAQREGQLAKLQGEIKVLKQRLETSRRNLASDVRDAERNAGSDLPALSHWMRQTENSIFNGESIGDLEGTLSMAEALLRKEQYDPAEQAFTQVKEGYEVLNDEFAAGERLHDADRLAQEARNEWQGYAKKYDFTADSQGASLAQQRYGEAQNQERSGALMTALSLYQQAQEGWQAVKHEDAVVARVQEQELAWSLEEKRRRAAAAADATARAAAQERAARDDALKSLRDQEARIVVDMKRLAHLVEDKKVAHADRKREYEDMPKDVGKRQCLDSRGYIDWDCNEREQKKIDSRVSSAERRIKTAWDDLMAALEQENRARLDLERVRFEIQSFQ